MADLIVKRHDTWPPVKTTLQQTNASTGLEEPINLATASKVTIILKGKKTLIEGLCVITGATKGEVEYTWGPSDTSEADTYQLEFEIDWGGGKIESVPNNTYGTVEIVADLPNA